MPDHNVDAAVLRAALEDSDGIAADAFGLLQDVCGFVAATEDENDAQEMVLRALEHKEQFGEYQEVLDGLARRFGLFPYLDPTELSLRDQIAYETHRPTDLDEDIVFHRAQANVYWALCRGENVVLSAPTSFGKSLIIDAVIAGADFENVLVIVPTIALIDETRRRLTRRFRHRYKVVTQPGQEPAERTIYVLTQERALELEDPPAVDLLVVDEFYKLSPDREDDTRCELLNQAVYRFTKTAKQFYMLGPNVAGFSPEFGERLEFRAIFESYRTVVSEFHRVDPRGDWPSSLVELCGGLSDPTIVFCRSPAKASDAVRHLVEAGLGGEVSQTCEAAADWVAEKYHPDWHLTSALRQGIGLHHGRIPRALAQFMVREFNAGQLPFLVCTSTLIEGVNTSARNIVILDNTIGGQKIDLFTFNNISGRAGRMGRHFIGHVYLFDPRPDDDEDLMFVDVPVFTQDDDTPETLLIQIDDDDLTERSKERINSVIDESVIDYSTIKSNIGVDIEAQLDLARELHRNLGDWLELLQWRDNPNWRQLSGATELIWNYFDGGRLARGSVLSAQQLTVLIRCFSDRTPTADLIRQQIAYCNGSADRATTQVLDFVRLWARFHFPRLLMALDRIQKDVLGRHGEAPGDYEAFATRVNNLFLPPEIVALDEYGIDLELARQIVSLLASDGDMDQTLDKLRNLDVADFNLHPFEVAMLEDAQSAI